MITIQISCSQCGKILHDVEIEASETQARSDEAIQYEVEKYRPWVVQKNGDNLDIYCSARCAE